MRKLGHGQSLMFFALPEVNRCIKAASPDGMTQALDILRWSMLENCNDIVHHGPHWARQALDYMKRRHAWKKYHTSESCDVDVLNAWLQPEARTMEQMYGVESSDSAGMEEEQEREVSHEIKMERQVQRPRKAKAANHQKVHADIFAWVRLGIIPNPSDQFVSIFSSFRSTSPPPLPTSWTPPDVDLRNQLNLWAGQLYLEDYSTYIGLCKFLGLYTEAGNGVDIHSDGFIEPAHRPNHLKPRSRFTESPMDFLKELVGLRRKGMDFSGTDIGKILHARLPRREDFERARAV